VLPVAVELVSVDVVAPVVLVDPLVAPMVLELELGEVELDVELLGEVDDVVLSVEADRDVSVEVELPGVVELLVVLELSGVDDDVLELGEVELPYVEPVPVELVPEVELGLVEELPYVEPVPVELVPDGEVELLGLVDVLPYVELVPDEVELVSELLVPLVLDDGLVEDVVLRLPLVLSFVVLGLVLELVLPYVLPVLLVLPLVEPDAVADVSLVEGEVDEP
jgi:hypothetical protein